MAHLTGPYIKTLKALEVDGLVEIIGTDSKRLYRLTEQGQEDGARYASTVPENIKKYIGDLASWLRSLTFPQLVSFIYRNTLK